MASKKDEVAQNFKKCRGDWGKITDESNFFSN